MFRSKSPFPLVVAIGLMLAIAYLVRPSGPVSAPIAQDEPQVTEEQISDMLGVIDSIASDESFFSMVLPDGGIEEIVVPESESVSQEEIGLIARINGVRDLATRRISAQSVQIEDEQNIYVTSPVAGSTVTSPLVVFGFGRVFEQTLDLRVKDEDGNIVREGYAKTAAQDVGKFGPFRFDIFLPVLDSTAFSLEVFQYSSRDGSEQDLVSVPLVLLNDKQTSFDVFFSSRSSLKSCDKVSASRRAVSNTAAVGRAALLELLAGPSDEERKNGVTTEIPSDVHLYSLAISNGEARADFSSSLAQLSVECEREKAFAQIAETLLQFSSVNRVVISADGTILATFD